MKNPLEKLMAQRIELDAQIREAKLAEEKKNRCGKKFDPEKHEVRIVPGCFSNATPSEKEKKSAAKEWLGKREILCVKIEEHEGQHRSERHEDGSFVAFIAKRAKK